MKEVLHTSGRNDNRCMEADVVVFRGDTMIKPASSSLRSPHTIRSRRSLGRNGTRFEPSSASASRKRRVATGREGCLPDQTATKIASGSSVRVRVHGCARVVTSRQRFARSNLFVAIGLPRDVQRRSTACGVRRFRRPIYDFILRRLSPTAAHAITGDWVRRQRGGVRRRTLGGGENPEANL